MSSSFSEYRAAGGKHGRINQKKELKRLEKVIEKAEIGGALSNASTNYNKWLRDNTGIKLLPNGKRETVWKTGESAGKPFDEKVGKKQWRLSYYGTDTPYQDLKYLKQLDKNETRLDRLRRNKLRIAASEKDWEGTPIHLLKVDQLEERLNKEAEELRNVSSYADIEVETPNNKKKVPPPTNEGGGGSGEGGNTVEGGTGEGGGTVEEGGGTVEEKNNQVLQGETWNTDQAVDANRLNENFDPYVENTGDVAASNVGPREKLTARDRMRQANVDRFGEAHVADLQQRNSDFQAMKRGEMTKAEFIELNPKSQTAKKAKRKKLGIRK